MLPFFSVYLQGACQKILVDVINSTRGLHGETTIFLAKKSYSLVSIECVLISNKDSSNVCIPWVSGIHMPLSDPHTPPPPNTSCRV